MGLVILSTIFTPRGADASIFNVIMAELSQAFEASGGKNLQSSTNSQNMPILQAIRSSDIDLALGGGDITVLGGTALKPESGPVGTMADIGEGGNNDTISTYVVRKGDTLGSIAKMFDVTTNTVRWANNIEGNIIREGQLLLILPISGTRHTVKQGDTLSSIAKKYKADTGEIAKFNNISEGQILTAGYIIIVPDGEIASPVVKSVAKGSNPLRGGGGPVYEGYYLRPILAGRKSQGLHGYNGIDLASYNGAPVFASAEGDVIVSMASGWNGGYGKYVVIAHANGTQTLYAHLSEDFVAPGDHVVRGQQIGLVGSTGKSTGPHLHFEVRGATNPF